MRNLLYFSKTPFCSRLHLRLHLVGKHEADCSIDREVAVLKAQLRIVPYPGNLAEAELLSPSLSKARYM